MFTTVSSVFRFGNRDCLHARASIEPTKCVVIAELSLNGIMCEYAIASNPSCDAISSPYADIFYCFQLITALYSGDSNVRLVCLIQLFVLFSRTSAVVLNISVLVRNNRRPSCVNVECHKARF